MTILLNLTPGPVDYRDNLDLQHAGYLFPHWSYAFAELHRDTLRDLRYVLGASNDSDVVLMAASGTGAIETLLRNVLEPGNRVLIIENGFFGQRLSRIVHALACVPIILSFPWDRPIDNSRVLDVIRSSAFHGIRAVCAVHLETSTGILNDLELIGHTLAGTSVPFLVDAVSSAGPHLVEVAQWGIDGLVTVSYKGLLAAPGLSVIIVSEKYRAQMEECVASSYYCDLKKMIKLSREHTTATTIPTNALTTLALALRRLRQRGRQRHCEQCGIVAHAIRNELQQLKYQVFGQTGLSQAITAIIFPDIQIAQHALHKLETHHSVLVGKGLGALQASIRIGHYGNFDLCDVPALVAPFGQLRTTLSNEQSFL